VIFSPDGQRLLTIGSDPMQPEPKVWNALNGEEQVTLRGHKGNVNWAAFFPDGRRLVTAGFDATCRVWDAATGKELLTLKGRNFDFRSVAVSPDGRRIVAGGTDNTAKVWEAASIEQVSDWQKEEISAGIVPQEMPREQSQKPNSTARDQASDPGRIRQWLVLAPIPLSERTHEAAKAALDRRQLRNENLLDPHADERVTVNGAELVWRPLQLEEDSMDLNQFLGAVTEWSLAYAVCYIESDRDQKGLVIKVDRDDWAKIFLNGTEIYRRDEEYIGGQTDWELDTAAGLELKEGANILVFKLVNEEGDWRGSVRFTDATGQTVKGIRVALTRSVVQSSSGR
jgi:hypothetical protein